MLNAIRYAICILLIVSVSQQADLQLPLARLRGQVALKDRSEQLLSRGDSANRRLAGVKLLVQAYHVVSWSLGLSNACAKESQKNS